MSNKKKPKYNFIDKTIGYFSPKMALNRYSARASLHGYETGYNSASYLRRQLKTWLPALGSADSDVVRDLPTLRARSRDAYRNINYASGAIKTLKTNVVGDGLRPQSNINFDFLGMNKDQAEAWQKNTEREFKLWSESPDCDSARTLDFYSQQALVYLSALMSGDVFILLPMIKRKNSPYQLALKVIEADQVVSPVGKLEDENKFIAGVEKDEKTGAPVAYHFRKSHPHSAGFQTGAIETTSVQAFGPKTGRRNVLHLFETERPGQTRGIPILSGVIEPLKMLGKYTDAELMAAVISAYLTIFIKNSDSGDLGAIDSSAFDEEGGDSTKLDEVKLGDATVIELKAGQDISTVSPGRPNVSFDGFVSSVLTQIGSSLEIPHELLVKQFKSSYSASRAALNEAWKHFRERRNWLSKYFCQPVYEAWLEEAVAIGRIEAPGFLEDAATRKAYSRVQWIGASRGQLDPEREVKAAERRVKNGFSTRAAETAALTGTDFAENIQAATLETDLMNAAGLNEDQPQSQQQEPFVDPDLADSQET